MAYLQLKLQSFVQKMGIDLIITDHHLVPEKKPKAYAIIKSKTKRVYISL